MRRPILNNSLRKDIIYDPFLGSGTTLIAAELTGRVCHGMEIDPDFVDVAVKRWQDLRARKRYSKPTAARSNRLQKIASTSARSSHAPHETYRREP
jgi:DNA modification methylase